MHPRYTRSSETPPGSNRCNPGTPPRPWSISIMFWFGVILLEQWAEGDYDWSLRMKPWMELNILVFGTPCAAFFIRLICVNFFSTIQLHTRLQNLLKMDFRSLYSFFRRAWKKFETKPYSKLLESDESCSQEWGYGIFPQSEKWIHETLGQHGLRLFPQIGRSLAKKDPQCDRRKGRHNGVIIIYLNK